MKREWFFKSSLLLLLSLITMLDGKAGMQDNIFREYDIRGKVGSELVIDEVYDLTRAIAYYFIQKNPGVRSVAVGMDGRTHSDAIKERVCAALCDSGLDVLFVGTCPSPALYFALHTLPVDAGIMITASHNPKEYNGMKLCLGTRSVWGNQLKEIRDFFKSRKRVENSSRGSLQDSFIVDTYVAWLVDHFKHLRGMDLSAIIDCGNGVAGTVLPQLIEAMDWPHVQLLYAEVDGTYPHHEADPVVEENMLDVKKILAETDISVGLGLDGDCDRMAPMTKKGFLVPGDQLLALFSKKIVEDNPGTPIVFDVKASASLIELLEQWGAVPVMSATGHVIIKNKMREISALLGGELSCHFCFNDRYFGYDDGIYAMMRLFEMLVESGESLEELLTIIPPKVSSPEFRLSYDESDREAIIDTVKNLFGARDDVTMITIDGVRVCMPYGWGIVRASNTQPVLSMRFEADTREKLQLVKQDFFVALQPYFDEVSLKEQIGL